MEWLTMVGFAKVPQFRIAVNSRCGRACFYCRPSGEGITTDSAAQLDVASITAVAQVALEFGVREFKLTGGDPALWEPLVDCVRALKQNLKVPSLHVISRHPRIGALAPRLADAGADLINISIDTLDPSLHHKITSCDDLPALLAAVRACCDAGTNCKINTVVMSGINDQEIDALIAFCEEAGVSTLKLLDMIRDLEDGAETYSRRMQKLFGHTPRASFCSLGDITDHLRVRAASIRTLNQGGLGHPMTAIMLSSGLEVVVKDHSAGAWYNSTICSGCRHYPCHDALMALRLTANARLQFCLLREDVVVDLRPHMASRLALREAVQKALSVYDEAVFHRDPPPAKNSRDFALPLL